MITDHTPFSRDQTVKHLYIKTDKDYAILTVEDPKRTGTISFHYLFVYVWMVVSTRGFDQ